MTNSELPAENEAKHAEFDPEPLATLAADEPQSSPFLPLVGLALFLLVGLWWGLTGPEGSSSAETVKAAAAPTAAPTAAPAKPVAARPSKPSRPRPPAGAAGVAAGRGTAPDIARLRNQIRQLNVKKAEKTQ